MRMLILGVNSILKWVQITTGGRRYTCPTKEMNGELYFHFKNKWHRVMDYVSGYTDELVQENGKVFSRRFGSK